MNNYIHFFKESFLIPLYFIVSWATASIGAYVYFKIRFQNSFNKSTEMYTYKISLSSNQITLDIPKTYKKKAGDHSFSYIAPKL